MTNLEDINLLGEEKSKRPSCCNCLRPLKACWCSWIKPITLTSGSNVVIIQHKNEAKRQIRTAQMLVRGITGNQCKVFVRSKINSIEDTPDLSLDEKELRALLRSKNTFVLFPTNQSEDAATVLEQSPGTLSSYTLVVIDGTWREAKKIYFKSPPLQALPTIHLDLTKVTEKSEYVVRTQPTDQCLSTVETVAHCLSILEKDTTIIDKLLSPLRALCSLQIRHGAVVHDSKEFKRDIEGFCKKNQRGRKGQKSENTNGRNEDLSTKIEELHSDVMLS